jgi:hypothetical protein
MLFRKLAHNGRHRFSAQPKAMGRGVRTMPFTFGEKACHRRKGTSFLQSNHVNCEIEDAFGG